MLIRSSRPAGCVKMTRGRPGRNPGVVVTSRPQTWRPSGEGRRQKMVPQRHSGRTPKLPGETGVLGPGPGNGRTNSSGRPRPSTTYASQLPSGEEHRHRRLTRDLSREQLDSCRLALRPLQIDASQRPERRRRVWCGGLRLCEAEVEHFDMPWVMKMFSGLMSRWTRPRA